MSTHFWQGLLVMLLTISLVTGCASSPYVGTGAALGGGLGALTGAAVGHRNPWAGALIGGAVGTAVGAAGGYAVQQRRASQTPQGYYYQQPTSPSYPAPAPPAYGYRTPAPGPSYGGAYGGYNTPNPVTPPSPQYSEAPAAPQYYSQNHSAQPSSVRTPITNAPYHTYE